MTDELTQAIGRLELWVQYWEPHQVPELITDLRTLINAAKAVGRAAKMLGNGEHIMLMHTDDDVESYAVPSQDVDSASETHSEGGEQ